MKVAAVVIQKWVRRFLAQKLKERRKKAAQIIRSFIKGTNRRHYLTFYNSLYKSYLDSRDIHIFGLKINKPFKLEMFANT